MSSQIIKSYTNLFASTLQIRKGDKVSSNHHQKAAEWKHLFDICLIGPFKCCRRLISLRWIQKNKLLMAEMIICRYCEPSYSSCELSMAITTNGTFVFILEKSADARQITLDHPSGDCWLQWRLATALAGTQSATFISNGALAVCIARDTEPG